MPSGLYDGGVGKMMSSSSDIGDDVPRFSLVEVTAMVSMGKLTLSFTYNKHMKHVDAIETWARNCQSLLEEIPQIMKQQAPERTLSAFPLLPLSYYGMQNLRRALRDTAAPIDLQTVEDIYPCSPMQRGLLLSQMRAPQNTHTRPSSKLNLRFSEEARELSIRSGFVMLGGVLSSVTRL